MLTLRKAMNLRPLFQLQGHLFSEKAKPQMSHEAQKALWAWKIINTIEKSEPPNDIFAPSLRDTLRNLPDPSPQFHFDSTIKAQMLNLFGQGVNLSSSFNSQDRIKRGQQGFKANSNFVFCPNYLATQPMFKILRKSRRFLLISGTYGISKTISLVLYSHLVRHIISFYYQANAAKDSQLLQEINILESKQLLDKQPKYWYWTINWTQIQQNGWRSVMDTLLDQSYELSQEQIGKLRTTNNLKEFIKALKTYYKEKNIQTYIIIDQLNIIASYMRKWNEFIFEKGDLLEKIDTLKENEQINLKQMLYKEQIANQRPAKQLQEIFDNVKVLGSNGFILNSSIKLEKSIIRNPYKNSGVFPASHTRFRAYPTLVLPLLGYHEEVVPRQIKYLTDLKQQFGKADFWHFFWFEVERKLLQQNFSRKKLEIAKRIFLLAASKAQVKGFYRNIYILDNIKKNPLDKQLQKMIEELKTPEQLFRSLSSGEQIYFSLEELQKMFPSKATNQKHEQTPKIQKKHPLSAYFQKYLQRFNEFVHTCERERLNDFMNIGNQQEKKRFLLVLISLAERSVMANSSFSYPVTLLNYALGKPLTQFFMSQENNQELLPAKKDENGIMHFEWTPEDFIALALPLISPNLGTTQIISLFEKFNKMHPVFRGVFFQLLFLIQLEPNTRLIFPVYQQNSDSEYFMNWTIEISKTIPFLPVNVKVSGDILEKETFHLYNTNKVTKQSIEALKQQRAKANNIQKPLQIKQEKLYFIHLDEHLKQIMEYCEENEGKIVAAKPMRVIHEQGQYYYQNENIDFLFAVKKQGIYEISAFDLTVNSGWIQNKIKGAKDYLERLVSSKQNTFVFTHYILCPSQKCHNKISIADTVLIKFISVDFKIENSQFPLQKFYLQEFQKINVSIRDKLDL